MQNIKDELKEEITEIYLRGNKSRFSRKRSRFSECAIGDHSKVLKISNSQEIENNKPINIQNIQLINYENLT